MTRQRRRLASARAIQRALTRLAISSAETASSASMKATRKPPGRAAFSAAMQMAALVAVISYFWKDVRELTFGSIQAAAKGDFADRHLRLAFWIIVATLPIKGPHSVNSCRLSAA